MPFLALMALLMAAAMAVSCLATLVLLPSLLVLTQPRFAFRPKRAATMRFTVKAPGIETPERSKWAER